MCRIVNLGTSSHLGSLDVSHVISEKLCEFQLLVRCYSSLYFLQKHKRRQVVATKMYVLVRPKYDTPGSVGSFYVLGASQTGRPISPSA